jgi:programmed cell death protein 5
MADDELNALRSKRMAELQGGQGGGRNEEEARKMMEQQEMMRNTILKQVLDQSAIARLSNLAAAKPDKAKGVEAMIVQMARSGQISGKLSDEALRQLLDKVSERSHKTTTVKFDRRRAALDSDED